MGAELLAAAEAKAYFGLSTNYLGLKRVSSELFFNSSMGKHNFEDILLSSGVKSFPSPFLTEYYGGYQSKNENFASSFNTTVIEGLKRINKHLCRPTNEKHLNIKSSKL